MRINNAQQTELGQFRQLFRHYTDVLLEYRGYWQLASFQQTQLPWHNTELCRYIQQPSGVVSDAELLRFFPALQSLPAISSCNDDAASAIKTSEARWPFWLTSGIGGRKLAQITAFLDAVDEPLTPLNTSSALADTLEWCAGKGHLGRLLSFQRQQAVTSVEWQDDLCQQGQQLAEQHQVAQRFVTMDVLSNDSRLLLSQHRRVLALHACGQLHLSLLQQAVSAQTAELHIAPCCYHLIDGDSYQPLSQAGKQRDLKLSRLDLKLAVQGVVTGGQRAQRLRQRELLWRMAYQCWRQSASGDNQYRPLGAVRAAQLHGELSEFVAWAASQQGLSVTTPIVSEALLKLAAAKVALIRQIESVQQLFRQPLELWLLLDRVLFLQEQGYEVNLRRFCAPQLTPRNWLIQAHRVVPRAAATTAQPCSVK
ncbi:methyltransferase [Idiomarina xiamenensis]|uniref:Methyltransferase domain-containing protein n=1 Tax=Idiomarina xiamenensis 10-D-4 TaxID=740709 RepID=K2KJX6_9GAMM|nr:methyltransferase [Idiomarina xiamenensis]EKE82909.1 hypothetical protein A10D4_08719 [Idiomarina xiamenensis 10-D-4]